MTEELILQVDENDEIIGLRSRDEVYKNNLIHRTVHLLLFNGQGELLLQKRAADKKWYPGLYTYPVSGTVADETYEEAMKREMKEEIGLAVPFQKLFKYNHFTDRGKAFKTVFSATSDLEVTLNEEAETSSWFTLDQLKKEMSLYGEDKFTPPLLKGIQIYFDKFSIDVPQ